MRRLTNDEYIAGVKLVHGDRYDLSLIQYEKTDSKVDVVCRVHGQFRVIARNLKNGQGCILCRNDKMRLDRQSNVGEFTERAVKVHGDAYDYTGITEYTNAFTKVGIRCKVHGVFKQSPQKHLDGRGCPKCGKAKAGDSCRLSYADVIDSCTTVHGGRYDYSDVVYVNATTPMRILCREHGEFLQNYIRHCTRGSGCPKCARTKKGAWFKSGFVESADLRGGYASLYLIRCYSDTESFYKIGITTKTVKQRFSNNKLMPYQYEVIDLQIGEPELIWELERLLHKEYKMLAYTPEVKFDGQTECFRGIDCTSYRKLLQVLA